MSAHSHNPAHSVSAGKSSRLFAKMLQQAIGDGFSALPEHPQGEVPGLLTAPQQIPAQVVEQGEPQDSTTSSAVQAQF